MGADRYDVVIVGGGSAGCALANRLSRRPGHQRARARGRPLRLQDRPAGAHAGGAAVPDRQPPLRLEVRDRPGAGPRRPPRLPRPRQGARRVQQHQRDDLPARQPARLRALGRRAGDEGVGLPPLPALLQEDGDLPRRRRRVARRRRAAEARARPGDQPAVRRVLPGRDRGRLPAHRRRQRLPPGGLREVRPQRLPRPPALRGARLPAPGARPEEPPRRDPGLRHRRPVPGQAGRRRRLPPHRSRQPQRRGRRGDPLRRRDQHPAAAPALRRRRPGAARAARHRRRTPLTGRRARTSRTTSRSTSSTPRSSRSRSRPACAGGCGRRSPSTGCSSAAASAPPTTSRAAASRAATTRSTTPT